MDPRSIPFWRFVIDVVVIACLGLTILFLFLWGKPFERGFNCDDQTLRYPYHDSTVSSIVLYIIGLILNLTAIFTLEILKWKSGERTKVRVFGKEVPSIVYDIYALIVVFGFGMAFSQFVTDVTKYWMGRLRPHFFDVCRPVFTSNGSSICNTVQFPYYYIDDYRCSTEDLAGYTKKLKEMRLSFPSGHSSYGMYTMLFFAIYLQIRWRPNYDLRLLKNVLQFGAVFFAIFVGMTRISDYKHHWSDVMGGLILGGVVAIVTMLYASTFFEKKRRYSSLENTENGHANLELANVNGQHLTVVTDQ